MRAGQRRVFRIEQKRMDGANGTGGANGADTAAAADRDADARHREVMEALRELRAGMRETAQHPSRIVDDYKRDFNEARKIKDDLNRIYHAIAETKREIATLRNAGRNDLDMSRMTDELGAIVAGTEHATETILNAAEEIDTKATDLVAALRQQANKDDASDIQEQVIKIFEACNFQDLTGQRITKVVNTFLFIEERVHSMMEIWGGMESFRNIQPVKLPGRTGHEELLNGPALQSDEDIASQDEIDALFD